MEGSRFNGESENETAEEDTAPGEEMSDTCVFTDDKDIMSKEGLLQTNSVSLKFTTLYDKDLWMGSMIWLLPIETYNTPYFPKTGQDNTLHVG